MSIRFSLAVIALAFLGLCTITALSVSRAAQTSVNGLAVGTDEPRFLNNACGSIVTLSGGALAVSNGCVQAASRCFCQDRVAATPLKCTPVAGTLAISGGGATDSVNWMCM